jgi:hypothetical protein
LKPQSKLYSCRYVSEIPAILISISIPQLPCCIFGGIVRLKYPVQTIIQDSSLTAAFSLTVLRFHRNCKFGSCERPDQHLLLSGARTTKVIFILLSKKT